MPTRRTTLKSIAAGTVVGSLSGCVQLATQRTVNYHGTPAMVSMGDGFEDGNANDDGWRATAVGVEAHSTVERVGITREIVAHSWGMLYSFISINNTGSTQQQVTMSFTTPSITVAGQELNPIKDLTVNEIAKEFLSITQTSTGPNEEHRRSLNWTDDADLDLKVVSDATGKKVLRAFRDSVRSPSAEYQPPSLDATASGGILSTVPDWDGDTDDRELTWATGAGDAGTYTASIRFEKHDGDFVVLFSTDPASVKLVLQGDYADSVEYARYVHPTDNEFNQEVLRRHLLDTNLRGMQAMVSRARQLIDETQELLAEASNKTRDDGDETSRVISETQDDLKQLDTILGGLGEDLQSVTVDKDGNFYAESTLDRIRERSKKAAAIAAEAREQVDNIKNDLEEHNGFIPIAQNLSGIKRLVKTVGEAIEYLENNAKDN